MGTKVCRRCNLEKPIADFYVHQRMADGHLNICKPCVKNRVRKHRRENDSVREYDRRRYHENENRQKHAAAVSKRWRQKYPERYEAHYVVSNAIRDKRLQKMPCEICGNPQSHAHHEDYSKPLHVKWLCAAHHQRLHHGEA